MAVKNAIGEGLHRYIQSGAALCVCASLRRSVRQKMCFAKGMRRRIKKNKSKEARKEKSEREREERIYKE